MLHRILLTGFEPNDDHLNASEELVRSLRDNLPASCERSCALLQFAILPGDTYSLKSVLGEHLGAFKPDICLFIGQAPGRNKVTFERFATNLRDFTVPDRRGNHLRGVPIEAEGPAAFRSTLRNQERLVQLLNESKIPAAMSNHAGNHLCNQVLYHGLEYSSMLGLNLQAGFIHIPPLPEQAIKQWPETPHMSLTMLRLALTLVLETLMESE
jgi:pyroglutamyl-peptidase